MDTQRLPDTAESGWFRAYVLMVCAVVALLAFQTPIAVYLPRFQFFDEAVLLIALAVIATHLVRLRVPRLEMLVVLLITYLLMVSLLFGQADSVFDQVAQVFIHLKFFLLYVLLRPLMQSRTALDRLERVFLLVGAATLGGLVLSFLVPTLFQETIGGSGISRFGLVRATGFQVKPNDAVLVLSPIILMLMMRAATSRATPLVIGLFLLNVFIFVANTSRIAALTIPVSALLLLLVGRASRAVNLLLMLVVLLLLPFLLLSPFMQEVIGHTLQNLEQFSQIDETEYIRVIMIYYSGVLAAEYFPIGSGAATYGSAMSEDSPVYGDLGLYGISLIDRFAGVFDSNVATLLGEFGVLGILLFAALTLYTFRDMRALMKSDDARSVAYHRVMLFFLLLVALTNPLYMYSLTSTMILLAAILGMRQKGSVPPMRLARPLPRLTFRARPGAPPRGRLP